MRRTNMLMMKADAKDMVQFINADRLVGFYYDRTADVTVIHSENGVSWQVKGDRTGKLTETLRMAGQLKVIDLGGE